MSEKNVGTFPLCGCVKTFIDIRDKHEHCYIHNPDYLHCIWCNAYKRQKESELSSVSPQPPSDALAESEKFFAHLNRGEVYLQESHAKAKYIEGVGMDFVRGIEGYRVVIQESEVGE